MIVLPWMACRESRGPKRPNPSLQRKVASVTALTILLKTHLPAIFLIFQSLSRTSPILDMSYYVHSRSMEEEELLRVAHQRQMEQDFPASLPRPPLFENVHRLSAAVYTPINPPYVPVNPTPSFMSHSSHNPSAGYLPPASHNLSTPSYMPSAPRNPATASYMSSAPAANYMQPSSANYQQPSSSANYMQPSLANYQQPSNYMQPSSANYMQPSSPAGYPPPNPTRWLPNVEEQQGAFRYVKTNTHAQPQKPRSSTRGGSPGFLYPPAARPHGLPPKPVVGK